MGEITYMGTQCMLTKIKKMYYKWKYGKVEVATKAYVEGYEAEMEYVSNKLGIIGYWAYGYFHPKYQINEHNSKYLNYEDWLYE